MLDRDSQYLSFLIEAVSVCLSYRPKMGKASKKGIDLETFQRLYCEDPFYNWFGLHNPLMYAAHKAAGGMTSIYRQIGIGCERLFRQILMDELGLTEAQSKWSYKSKTVDNRTKTLSLDGRIELADVMDAERRERISSWIAEAAEVLSVDDALAGILKGVVFEVRQGYKSKDSKRQNADIANATVAYTKTYLPCVSILSMQIDDDVSTRYLNEKWLVLKGTIQDESPHRSTYAFMRDVLGYDLAAFFERNAKVLSGRIDEILNKLLSPE